MLKHGDILNNKFSGSVGRSLVAKNPFLFANQFYSQHASNLNHSLEKRVSEWQKKSLLDMDKDNILKNYFELLQENNTDKNLVDFKKKKDKKIHGSKNNKLSYKDYTKQFSERLRDVNELHQESRNNYSMNITHVSSNWINDYLNGKRLKKNDANAMNFGLQNYIDNEVFCEHAYNKHGKLAIDWKKLDMNALEVGDCIVLNVSDSSNVLDKFKIGIVLKLPYFSDSDIIMYCSDGDLYYLNPKSIILKLGKILKIDEKNVSFLFKNFYETCNSQPMNSLNQEFLSTCNLDIMPKEFQRIFNVIYTNLKTDIVENYQKIGYFMNKLDSEELQDIESLYLNFIRKIEAGNKKHTHRKEHFDASVIISILLQLIERNNKLFTNGRGVPINFKPKSSTTKLAESSTPISDYVINGDNDISSKLRMVEKLMKTMLWPTTIGKRNMDVLCDREYVTNGGSVDFAKNPFYQIPFNNHPKQFNLSEKDVESLDTPPLKRLKFDHPVYCIDSSDTVEVDDGVSIEHLSNNTFRIHCHIASLGRFFLGMENNKIKQAIFEDALKASTSVYLPNCRDFMLKEQSLVNYYSINSKRSNNKTLSFSVVFKRKKNSWQMQKGTFAITEYDTLPKVKNLTYEDVAKEIGKKSDLNLLYELSNQLNKKRNKESDRNSSAFGPKIKFTVDNINQHIERESEQSFTKSQILVSELMLLFNHLVAEYSIQNNIPFIYRVNDLPLEQKISSSAEVTINKSKLGAVNPVNPLLISHPASEYSIHPRAHYATGLPHYTHITSPLRRIVDCLNHIQLLKHIRKIETENPKTVKKKLSLYLNKYINSTMKLAKTISNKTNWYYELQYLKQKNNLSDLLKKGGLVTESPIGISNVQAISPSITDDSISSQDLPSDDIEIRRSISVINVDSADEKTVKKPADDVIIGNHRNLYVLLENGVVAKLHLSKPQQQIRVGDHVKDLKLERLDAIAGDFLVSL